MGAKVRLLKNIIINFFIILLAYINLIYSYLILFLNGSQLSVSLDIFATSAIASLSPTGFLAWPLLPSLNLINLNLLWFD